MLDTRFVRNTERFVGQEFDAKIKEVDPKENRFILSRREVVEAVFFRINFFDFSIKFLTYETLSVTYETSVQH